MSSLASVLTRLDNDRPAALERLFALLRIPSISTDPAYENDCLRAAQLIVDDLKSIGFDASVRPTAGRPAVVGHYNGAGPSQPRALFYAHYDVQPADPLELWNTPPFEPCLVPRPDGGQSITARGASDDKGQLYTFIEACRQWMAETGALPINITIFVEGEEESGSKSLVPFLEANRAELECDFAMICDSGLWNRQTPNIPISLRGNLAVEFTVTGANQDLHSGMYGPVARNPNHVVADILASFHDADGRVLVDGFYDDVDEPDAELLKEWDSLGFSGEEFLGRVGLSIPAGEKGRSILEMLWSRPTCEITGMHGGYIGSGFKTVLPAESSAKVSFRLVGRQSPDKINAAFQKHVAARVPEDCSVSFITHSSSPAVEIARDRGFVARAGAAWADEWGTPPVHTGVGGSIPVVGYLKTVLGMDSLLVGFAFRDDRIHSPNEKYEIESYQKGARTWARILSALKR